MVVEILKENGINAETVSCDTDMFKHVDVLLTTRSGKKYIINYLEDIENIQTGMKTRNFGISQERIKEKLASEVKGEDRTYHVYRLNEQNEGEISFIDQDKLSQIDEKLGYKQCGLYMDDVIEQVKKEFKNFRIIMAENEYLTGEMKQGEKKTKSEIYEKWQNMTDDEILEKKLDWLFNYFNERMDLTGHTDFVMYYSRLLLKQVLTPEEYKNITRYDCFLYNEDIPEQCKILNILDFKNAENKSKIRFCLLEIPDKAYAFSTKPNEYQKLTKEEMEEVKKYAVISKTERPSDLVLKLCDRGNALPLIFHPLGSKILNERADLIDNTLSREAREKELEKLANSIETTDGEITSITIPYPDGEKIYIYIDKNYEFVVQSKKTKDKTIYHYDEETDSFIQEKTKEDDNER